jgi:acyl-CoA dehydrogenase
LRVTTGITDRVTDHTTRFASFLDAEVAPLEAELAAQDVGTA